MRNLIPVKCTNQTLYFERLQPVITSGDINEDVIVFDFCPMWDGFQKTAVFYRTLSDVYHVLVQSDNTCIIPKEVLVDPGEVSFGVFGVKDDRTRTSEEILLTIKQGAITEATAVSDPTPDIYTQIISMLNATSAKVEETEDGARITIKDVHGETEVAIKNGKDGEQGPQGIPGVTPEIPRKKYVKLADYTLESDAKIDFALSGVERVFVKAHTPKTAESLPALEFRVYAGGVRIGRVVFPATTTNGSERWGCCEFFIDFGWWRSRGSAWVANNSVNTDLRGYDFTDFLVNSESRVATKLDTSAALPAGTEIEIWGVEMDSYAVATLEELDM